MTPTIAHCTVSRSDWPEWLRINADLPADFKYDAFLEKLGDFCDSVAAEGGRAIKINVNPADFADWCRIRGCEIDTRARASYAAAMFAKLNVDGTG